jgi:phage terminase large subunit
LALCFPQLVFRQNNSDLYITLSNGSEIWVGGLDNKERVEKILGNEYSTIFFNECSQLDTSSINTALTRLAEKNTLKKKVYYDENPPSKKHWSYWKFIKHIDPISGNEVDSAKYVSMVMNPMDNLENIDEDYIKEVLADLGPREKQRFMLGEFCDAEEGLIYYSFNRDDHVKECSIKSGHPIWAGMDFNVNPMTAPMGQLYDGKLYIFDEAFLKNSNTPKMCQHILDKYGRISNIVPDSTGKKQTTNANRSDIQIIKSYFGDTAVKFGTNPFRIDRYAAVNAALAKGLVIISPKCKNLINDLESLSYKEGTDKPDTRDPMLGHIADAFGYLIYKTINPLKAKTNRISSQTR